MSQRIFEVPQTKPSVAWFSQFSAHWSAMGLALEYFDSSEEQLRPAPSYPRFFKIMRRRMEPYRILLRSLAQESVASGCAANARFSDSIFVIAMPIRSRRRVCGSVLATACCGPLASDETWLGACGTGKLDQSLMIQLAEELPRYDHILLEGIQKTLSGTSQMAFDRQSMGTQLSDVSRDLTGAYEEINLLYKVAGSLRVTVDVDSYLNPLCNELAEVLETEAIIVIVPAAWEDGGVSGTHPYKVVSVGKSLSDEEGYLRIGRQIGGLLAEQSGKTPQIIMDSDEDDVLDWAAEWIRNLAAVSIQCNRSSGAFPLDPRFNSSIHLIEQPRSTTGVVLALNKRRDVFRSSDLKMLVSLASQSGVYLDNLGLYADLHHLMMGLLHALVSSIDAKDPYTSGHSHRVAILSRRIAEQAGLTPQQCERIYLAGLLHDVGKIGVPEPVLCKTGKLTEDEFDEMKKHPEIGARILCQVRQIQDIIPGVLYHHERIDGRGYPYGLSGDDIPFMGRVVCLADSFDAMTTTRTYRSSLPLRLAEIEIRRCSGVQFDPRLGDAFLQIDKGELGEDLRKASNALPDFPLTVSHKPSEEL
jgi:HD-GYP domain-containing protein (c-di-GMP phosphodiesterase class II)